MSTSSSSRTTAATSTATGASLRHPKSVAVLFRTHEAAIVSSVSALVRRGDHVILLTSIDDLSSSLLMEALIPLGIELTILTDHKAVTKSVRPNTRVIFTKSLSDLR